MCFSNDKDSLSKWRAYGDDAKGIVMDLIGIHCLLEMKWVDNLVMKTHFQILIN